MFNERDTLKVLNGHLNIGGCDTVDLAKTYGTPLYVMDEQYMRRIVATYMDVIAREYAGNGIVKYASKAFCCKEILRIMNSMSTGLDVVSGGELHTAVSVGFPAEKIYFHGNNKSDAEINMAFDYGVQRFVVDSLDEIQHINEMAAARGKVQEVLLRVNPGIEAHTHHFIQTAKLDSKFGLAIACGYAEKGAIAIQNSKNLRLFGLHCHIGSQIFERQAFELAAEKMMDFIGFLKCEHGIAVEELNMGGGYGIWYSEGDKKMKPADYADFISAIIAVIKGKAKQHSVQLPFFSIEPGRSIVGEAGITLYSAGAVKNIEGIRKFVSVDGGMFENPRYALYQAKYTAINASRADLPQTDKVTLTGKCCESGDMLIDEAHIAGCERGDIIAVFSTGAYNYSMASNYNRNAVPPVVCVNNGEARLMIKPQTLDDIIRNDV